MIKAIGFDFDGTLIMSEDKKKKEMAAVFREKFGVKQNISRTYNALLEKGYTRDAKVTNLFEKYVKRKPTKKELKVVADHFGQHYAQSLSQCPLFECVNMLKELRKQVRFLFLLSLENKKEVMKVAQHCGVAQYFDEILGGPTPKVDNLEHVLRKHHVKPSETIYIGDAHSDVLASKKLRVKAILLGKKHTYEQLKEDLEADFVFSSLCDVPFSTLAK